MILFCGFYSTLQKHDLGGYLVFGVINCAIMWLLGLLILRVYGLKSSLQRLPPRNLMFSHWVKNLDCYFPEL